MKRFTSRSSIWLRLSGDWLSGEQKQRIRITAETRKTQSNAEEEKKEVGKELRAKSIIAGKPESWKAGNPAFRLSGLLAFSAISTPLRWKI